MSLSEYPNCVKPNIYILTNTDINNIKLDECKKKMIELLELLRNMPIPITNNCPGYSELSIAAEQLLEVYASSEVEDTITNINNQIDKPVFIVMVTSKTCSTQDLHSKLAALTKLKSRSSISCYILTIDVGDDDSKHIQQDESIMTFCDIKDLLVKLFHDIGTYFENLVTECYDASPLVLTILERAKVCFTQANNICDSSRLQQCIKRVSTKLDEKTVELKKYSHDNLDKMLLANTPCTSHNCNEEHSLDSGQAHCSDLLPESCELVEAENKISSVCWPMDIDHPEMQSSIRFNNDGQCNSKVSVVFYMPTKPVKRIDEACNLLKYLLDIDLILISEDEEWPIKMKASNTFIFVLPWTSSSEKVVLENVCEMSPTPIVFVFNLTSEDAIKLEESIPDLTDMCTIVDTAEEMATQITLEIAFEYRTIAEDYKQNNMNILSVQMYERCCKLWDNLKKITEETLDKIDECSTNP